MQILIVADAFPKPANNALAWNLLPILRALCNQNHDVTLVMRDGQNRNHYESLLKQLNIRIFAGDKERLVCLGIEAHPSDTWSLTDVFVKKSFAAAFLFQNFDRGVSLPEQYLDDIRRHSPYTRVAVFCDHLSCLLEEPALSDKATLLELEQETDRIARERELIERVDLVVASRKAYATMLREEARRMGIVVLPAASEVSEDFYASQLANILEQLSGKTAQPRAQQAFSVMQVETIYAVQLAEKTGENRIIGQLESYARLATQFLTDGKFTLALEQLRHIFGRSAGSVRGDQFHAQVFVLLKRCYRELNQLEMAERCASEARQCAMRESAGSVKRSGFAKPLPGSPQLSVIVPTYNRLSILKKCLAALEAQTLSTEKFEVIVIDDGSSDGTEEFMRQYTAPFQLQYLRQKNSGTGAARSNGVTHATGEYLLLMNDDTICDRDVAEQHLRVQRAYPGQRWAVLGNFEYPAAARERALTHYFRVEPFMFPQVNMEEGCPYGYSHFITCNLSIRREALVQAGSFDSTYKLSEDTEMGLRLHEKGYRVLYHPSAHAWHDHLPYPTMNLIRRAKVYGADYFHMFRRHPRVMKEWAMPIKLTAMDAENALRIQDYVAKNRLEVEDAVIAVEKWDAVDFEPLLTDQPDTATLVLGLLRQAVPAIHWFYLFETMLHTMVRELHLTHLAPDPIAIASAAGG